MLVVFALVIAVLFVCGVLVFVRPSTGFITTFSIALLLSGLAIGRIELVVAGFVIFVATMAAIVFKESGLWARRILITCGLVVIVVSGYVLFEQWGLLNLTVFLLFVGMVIGIAMTKDSGLWARRILITCGLVMIVVSNFVLFEDGGLFGLIVFLLFVGTVIGIAMTLELSTAAFVISTIGS